MVVRSGWAALAAVLALVVAGCGEKAEDEPGGPSRERLQVVLDYLPNPDHVGFYAAQRDGSYAKAGLDVELRVPPDPSAPLKLLASRRADLVISYEPELLLARARGLRAVSVAAIAQKPLTSIMSVDGKVPRPRDLAGKTVGTAGIPYQAAYLKTIAERAGIDPGSMRRVDVGFNLVPAMLSGKADATLGAFWNIEGVELARRDRRPAIIRMEQAGVPTYDELVLVVRQDTLREKGNAVRRLVRAVAAGYRSAREDPAAATRSLVAANPDLNQDTSLAQVRASLPVFFPAARGRPWGFQDASEWRAYGQWMVRNGLLSRASTDPSDALTNAYLPGQGLEEDGPS